MKTTLAGSLVGNIWMPNTEASLSFTADIGRERARFTERPTFREVLLHILREKGGDFQNASFGFDAALTVTRYKTVKNRLVRTSKTYELAAFPSVKDLVDENATIFSEEGV